MEVKRIAHWTIEVDAAATEAAYAELPLGIGCTCKDCRNFVKAAPSLPKAVGAFFAGLGADVLKPAEIYGNYIENGRVYYGGFYQLVGRYVSGYDVWQPYVKGAAVSHLEEPKMLGIASGFQVGFTKVSALIPKGFPRPALQMEVNFSLPWVLDEDYYV